MPPSRTMNAIVTNAKNRIAYSVVRSLGERGVDVYTADFVPVSMSFTSRFSKGHFIYPSPFKDQESFIDSIIENVRRFNARVLIPVFEETFLLSKYKDIVSSHVAVAIPDYDQVLTAHNKDRWMPLAQSLGIPVPRTFSIKTLRDNGCDRSGLRFPLLVKPYQGGGAWGISPIETPAELDALLTRDTYLDRSWERFCIQERIRGTVHCVAMLFNQGRLRGHVVYRQLRDLPFTGGQATLRVSIDSPIAAGHFQTLLEKLSWHGVCQADFVIEEGTGIPYLIDINPRLWGSLVQGIASGVDFPYMLYRIALDGDTETVADYTRGVVTRWIWGDLRTFPDAFRSARDKVAFLREYVGMFGKRVVFDDFYLHDPLPFFTFGIDFLTKMIGQRTFHPASHDSLEGIWE